MSKNQSFDEQLKVISPCSESWEEMVGNDKVRFCSHCQKSVHNLSEMTKGEALNLALKSNGRLCVRYRMADQKIKFKDSKVVKPSNFSPLLKVAASGLFALTLSSGVSLAQSVIPTVDTSQLQTQTDKTQNLDPNSGSNIVTGTVVDPQGAVIAGARVSLNFIGAKE